MAIIVSKLTRYYDIMFSINYIYYVNITTTFPMKVDEFMEYKNNKNKHIINKTIYKRKKKETSFIIKLLFQNKQKFPRTFSYKYLIFNMCVVELIHQMM